MVRETAQVCPGSHSMARRIGAVAAPACVFEGRRLDIEFRRARLDEHRAAVDEPESRAAWFRYRPAVLERTSVRFHAENLARWFVVGTIVVVSGFDVVTGTYLLTSDAPHLAHGAEGPWADLAPLLEASSPHRDAVLSTLRRVGAFQSFAGLMTLAWLIYAKLRDEAVITVLMGTYLVFGVLFFLTDRAFFAGTSYLLLKQAIGTLWLAAFAVHLRWGRGVRDLDAPQPG